MMQEALEGTMSAQKAFERYETRTRELLAGKKVNRTLPMRGYLFTYKHIVSSSCRFYKHCV